MTAINEVVDLDRDGEIGIITLDSPPVNALSPQLVEGIYDAFVVAIEDERVRAIVLICAGRTFIAGADLKSMGKEPPKVDFFEMQDRIENAGKPVVAAIHGTCLGGGMELALTCHYRIATHDARLGLPEVNLGLLPGGGGTQRLPRIVGIETALELLTSGRQVAAGEAHDRGLVDMIATSDLRQSALNFAQRLVTNRSPARRARDLELPHDDAGKFQEMRAQVAQRRTGEDAPLAIIRCVEAAAAGDFEAGLKVEREEFQALLTGPQSAALRHLFFAERKAAKVEGIADKVRLSAIGLHGSDATLEQRLGKSRVPVKPVSNLSSEEARAALLLCAASDDASRGAGHAIVSDTALGPENSGNVRVRFWPDRLVEIVAEADADPGLVARAMGIAGALRCVAVLTLGGGKSIGERLVLAAGHTGGAVDGAAPLLDAPALAVEVARQIVADGAAQRASDVDVAANLLGWPGYMGGPLFQAG
ncbi:enoyl-CoA hydratase-related protein [Pacificimonas sp. ICDLI1SI03]